MQARLTSASTLLALLFSIMVASQASAGEPGPRARSMQPGGGIREPTRVPYAEPSPPREESTAPPSMVAPTVEYDRYGLEIMLADAAVLVTSLAFENPRIAIVGYGLNGPAMHMMHGNGPGALYSLGIRGLLPVGAFFIGGEMSGGLSDTSCGDEPCGFYGAFIGGLIGLSTALVLDWTVLAKKPVRTPRAAGLTVAPNLAIDQDHVSFGLAGAF